MTTKRGTKRSPSKVSDEAQQKVVALALQNPDLGVRRLMPLLKEAKVDISPSTAYTVLKRHGLQTCAKRQAKLEAQSKRTRKPKSPPKKPTAKITDDVSGRICEISLQNPDLRTKSLAPLLKEKGISVSASSVYRILKHHELHTRAKRFARAAEISAEPVVIPKTFSEKIAPEVEDRIVEISLQNPEYGVRRLLPLLQQKEIFASISAVYRILKRNNLENRQKRLLKLEALQAREVQPEAEILRPEPIAEAPQTEPTPAADEAPEPVFEPEVAHYVQVQPVDEAPAKVEEPGPIAESGATVPISFVDEAAEPTPVPAVAEAAESVEPAANVESEPSPSREAPVKLFKRRSPPAFYPLYLILLVLIGYMGFQAFQAVQYARSEPGTVSATDPAAAGIVAKAESSDSERQLNDYRMIWQRNLFGVSAEQAPVPQKEIAVEKLAPAEKDLGLTLVGTVVAGDASLRRAFIDDRRTRKQKAYREGETAGEVRIKKILRNRVIVATREGDRVLSTDMLETGIQTAASAPPQEAAEPTLSAQAEADSGEPEIPVIEARLGREEVMAGLSENDYLMKQVLIYPYTGDQGEQLEGFQISNLRAGNVLVQMGLRSGDVIKRINGRAVGGPDDAAGFFERLTEGGEVTIDINRRRQPLKVRLNIG